MHRRSFLQLLAAAPLIGQVSSSQRHVVIVSIDGLAAFSFHDEKLPLPSIRALAARGAIAESMEPVNPTVTWPNHTAMITGVPPARHGVLYNGNARQNAPGEMMRVEPWLDKPELVKVPTLYDVAHAAGMTTAEVDWVAIQNARTITYAFPERPRLTDPIVKEMIAAGAVTEAGIRDFLKTSIVWRDEIWTRAGEHIIERHRPNLLLFHLLATDSSQHRYAPSTLAAETSLTLADAKIQRLLDSLKRAGILDRTTIFVVSDHGFRAYHHLIQVNAVLRRQGLVRTEGGKIACDAWAIPEGGTAMLFVTRPDARAEVLPKLKAMFTGHPGVIQVIEAAGFAGSGYPPTPGGQMPDLVLAAAPDYAFGGAQEGESLTDVPAGAGTHGYLRTDAAMDATFIASGAGIKPGSKLGRIRNIDVAPTAAKLLGLELKDVEGRVLTGILT